MINWVTVLIIGILNAIAYFNREGLGIGVDLSLPAERVIWALDHIIEWSGKPCSISCDNEPEYISGKLAAWAANIILNWTLFSLVTRGRMLILNAITVLFVMIGSLSICLKALPLSKIMRLNGSGATVTNDLIWGLVALSLNKSWP